MKKLFKWPGGKSKEIKIIDRFIPDDVKRIVEPFAGSAAVSFHYEKDCVLNDLNQDIINFYEVMSNQSQYSILSNRINNAMKLPFVLKGDPNYGKIQSLEKEFYDQREVLNKRDFSNKADMAYAFFIVRQLCFSGMLRHNPNNNNFNVPYGWYKKFTNNLTVKHHNFLKKSVITNVNYDVCIGSCDEDDWIFVDPPYRKRAGYPTGEWDDNEHINLANALKSTKAKWLLVHCDDDLYLSLYKNFKIVDKNFNYNIAFKDRNKEDRKVKHLYITNY